MSPTPPAIVLCSTLTGLATVRALGRRGIEVIALVFDAHDPVIHSRHATRIVGAGNAEDEPTILRMIQQLARESGERPVVMPTSDKHALLLAEHADALRADCRLWTTAYEDLSGLVCKNALYRLAQSADVPIVPYVADATIAQIEQWSADHPGPYLLKPIFDSAKVCHLREKNHVVPTRAELLDYLQIHGTDALVIQRVIKGGDGEIYDTYGLCDASGAPRAMASHRRLRQNRPNFGTTCFGRIPSGLGREADARMFELTERLLSATRFHGIFGIEWLRDRSTGNFYLIDFNARPFLSIGHLVDCGMNLPYLAYLDLIGAELPAADARPPLRALDWIDLLRDAQAKLAHDATNPQPFWPWMLDIVRANSRAYWDWTDPIPGLARARDIANMALRVTFRSAKARLHIHAAGQR